MVKYYHGTVKAFLPAIKKEGLKNFGQRGIFVTTDEQQAWFWAQAGAMEYSLKHGHTTSPVVLEISPKAFEGHRIVVDLIGAEEGFDYYILGLRRIPPHLLKTHEHIEERFRLNQFQEFIEPAYRPVRVRGHRRRT